MILERETGRQAGREGGSEGARERGKKKWRRGDRTTGISEGEMRRGGDFFD